MNHSNLHNMTDTDAQKLLNNKFIAENFPNSPEASKAHADNVGLRQKYNMGEDKYSYVQARDILAGRQTDLQRSGISGIMALRNKKFKSKYGAEKEAIYKKLRDFEYNPQEDEAFLNYKKAAKRESEAAQNATYQNLVDASGGRNSTWASAATAQVGQEYAGKIAEKASEYGEKAYERLLSKYQAASDMDQTEYQRFADEAERERMINEMAYGIGKDEQNTNISENQRVNYETPLAKESIAQAREQTKALQRENQLGEEFDSAERKARLENMLLENDKLEWANYLAETYGEEEAKLRIEDMRRQGRISEAEYQQILIQNEWLPKQLQSEISKKYDKLKGGDDSYTPVGFDGFELNENFTTDATMKNANYIKDGEKIIFVPGLGERTETEVAQGVLSGEIQRQKNKDGTYTFSSFGKFKI